MSHLHHMGCDIMLLQLMFCEVVVLLSVVSALKTNTQINNYKITVLKAAVSSD